MGEVHLDAENLFYGFGWAPNQTRPGERMTYLSHFRPRLRLDGVDDLTAVRSMARSAARALMSWSRRFIDRQTTPGQPTTVRARSYGKLDPGVKAVSSTLRAEGVWHQVVPTGRDRAELAMLDDLDSRAWLWGPYVLGSSDARVVGRANECRLADPHLSAVVVMRPDVYARRRGAWFSDPRPTYRGLSEYDAGHVALHLLTHAWLREESAGKRRRADPVEELAVDSAGSDETTTGPVRSGLPRPSPELSLSSSRWFDACVAMGLSEMATSSLREQIRQLYGDAFEHGDGPTSWGMAYRAAAATALVRHHVDGPPEGLTPSRLAAYEEARRRLMSRTPDEPSSDG